MFTALEASCKAICSNVLKRPEIMISISEAPPMASNMHASGWKTTQIASPHDFAKIITRHTWSPIIWKDGRRRQDNFLECRYGVLDIDDGLSISEVISRCEKRGLAYIIAPSKSHQKPKNDKPPCDRFRLIFFFSQTITDLYKYRYNMEKLTEEWSADKACKDGARFFYPSNQMLSSKNGFKINVQSIPPPSPRLEAQKRFRLEYDVYMAKKFKKLPHWVSDFVERGILKDRGRNHTCFVVARKLFELGFNENEISDMIRRAPFDRNDFKDREIYTTVASAKGRR